MSSSIRFYITASDGGPSATNWHEGQLPQDAADWIIIICYTQSALRIQLQQLTFDIDNCSTSML